MHVVIVGSGPSALGYQPPDGVTVIAVNNAIRHLKRADFWFTLDPSAENQWLMAHRRNGTKYCAAVQDHVMIPTDVIRYRIEISMGDEPSSMYSPEWWLWRWSCKLGLSENPDTIHTGNSAYGALGLAYHMRPERIDLIGIDANECAKVGGGYSKSLSHLPLLFASAKPQLDAAGIAIYNLSKQSTIDCFPRA